MFDLAQDSVKVAGSNYPRPKLTFFAAKRLFDIVFCIALVPVVAIVAVVLVCLNPLMNPGPLLYAQKRMGLKCRPFTAYKFRSMLPVNEIKRRSTDPIEHERITKFGNFLRRSRLDELPQVFNVVKGEMSLIGPRPDYYPHAVEFLRTVPGYEGRHNVRPGISGLAQTEVGYVQGPEETRRKVSADLYYIKNLSFRLEAWIFWRTICTVFYRRGL